MNTEIQQQQQQGIDNVRTEVPAEVIEKLVLHGDLSGMQPQEKTTYYNGICRSLGLNPLTQPFAITKLNGKEVMYAKKDCTEQLRKIYGVSVTEIKTNQIGDIYMVTATGTDRTGRVDSAIGAVSLTGKTGEALANQIMKAETKAKRRFTLSICGLGMLDETEVSDITPDVSQQSSSSKSVSIDVIEPSPENKEEYGGMLNFLCSEEGMQKVSSAEILGGMSHREFANKFWDEFNSGFMPKEKAQNIYNRILECAQ